MTHDEHLMTIAAEEAMEVGHRVTKAMRFGLGEVQAGQSLTNGERIIEEFHDLYSMLDWLVENGLLPDVSLVPDSRVMGAKRAKVDKFLGISRAQGTLDQSKEHPTHD